MKKNLALITLLIVLFSIFLFSCKNNNDALLSKLKEIEYNRNSNANLLLSSVKSNDKEIRLLATQVLARIQSAESKDILVKLLKDENSDIRNWAVFGLGQLRDSSMAAFLVEQLKIEPDIRVKSNILVALGKTGINDKDMIFIPYLKNNDPEVASAAAMGIAFKAIQKDVSLKTVKELENIYLNSINIKVKGAVAFALFRIADTTDLKIFEQMLTDNNINTRYYAIRGLLASLRKIKEEFKSDNKFSDFILKEKNINLRKILKIGLNDKNWEIQYYSFSLLEFIPGIDISEKFISEPEKNHKYIIQALLNNLRYLNPESAKAILSKLLVSKNNHISGMAHAEQTREEPDEGLMFIKRILQNPSQPDLYYAVEALNLVPDNLLKEYKNEFLKLDNIFWLTNLYGVLGQKKILKENDILAGLKRQDLAVTTIIADYLTQNPHEKYTTPLINAFYNFSCPVDAEPMIALLIALDATDNREVADFFKNIEDRKEFNILFKNKNDWKYIDRQNMESAENLLKSDFSSVKSIPEFVKVVTSKGDIKIKLLPEVAPVTVSSFLSLAAEGYFNGLSFHRVVPGFVIQGGDPRGDGWGGPGYSLPCEYSMLEYETGMVGMAHAGMDTGGSQFFITQMPQPHLNGRYTIWGKVKEGMDVVNSILPYDKIERIEF